VTYRRRTSGEYDRKIIELLRETVTINARMLRIALDLDAAAASRVLSDLVEPGVLAKTSEAQRGPSVTYGPRPQFPASSGRTPRQRTSRATGASTPGSAEGSLFDLRD
jgi:ATP-dependent DNA helicase RecG